MQPFRKRKVAQDMLAILKGKNDPKQTRALPEDLLSLGLPGLNDFYRKLDLSWTQGLTSVFLFQVCISSHCH